MISRVSLMVLSFGAVLAQGGAALAQQAAPAARPLITQALDEKQLVPLAGSTRRDAREAAAQPAVADGTRFEHVQLMLKRSPEREQAAVAFVDALSQRGSPSYHHWLTAAEYGRRFGAADTDVQKITTWLKAKGFTVNHVEPSRLTVDFSGDAGQIARAFHTHIRRFASSGAMHVANDSDPQVPAALAPAIAGFVSLNDFHPLSLRRPRQHPRAQDTGSCGGQDCYAVGPGDLATIYNLTPLFNAGYTGQGQTIAVVESTNLYNNADWTNFRNAFGLNQYGGNLQIVHPAPSSGGPCANPGVTGDDGEAALDTQWAAAAAPSATIMLASCASTGATDGVFLAIQNLVNASAPPAVISVSYALCEAENGAGENAAFDRIYQQAVAEGISVFVAAGDSGAAGCSPGPDPAWSGIGINGWGDSQYIVSVGGTDFRDRFDGDSSSFWGANTGAPWSTAKSYVPEIPWNDNCASTVIALYYSGSAVTFGSNGFCNSGQGSNFFTLSAGGGGPSRCYSGAPNNNGIVSGSCRGYPKPYWQKGIAGVPRDGVRDTPDISLLAANGIWGHAYATCYTDPNGGGGPCSGNPASWAGNGGGTSYGAPVMAGIQALVNQRKGGPQGNAAPVLYAFAAQQYGKSGNPNCSANLGRGIEGDCVFHDIVTGNADVYCQGGINCYQPSGGYGELSALSTGNFPSYRAGQGYDMATGLGSVNAYNLVMQWPN
jgi:subtilase family serine protease